MLHLHVTAWALGLILFILSFALKGKAGKILHMILRLDYLLILYSGIHLLVNPYLMNFEMPLGVEAITKGLAGIWLIAAMEMILVKSKKGQPVVKMWVQFFIALILVLILGYVRLPLTF
jgi:uncharacterized membrane protein SirB2